MKGLGFCIILLILGVIVVARQAWVRRARDRRHASREQFSPAAFAETYFPESQLRSDIAAKARRVIEEQLKEELPGLRPGDRLAADICVNDSDGMELAELVMSLEDAFAVEIPEDSRLETFGDVVDCIEELTSQGAKPPSGEPTQ